MKSAQNRAHPNNSISQTNAGIKDRAATIERALLDFLGHAPKPLCYSLGELIAQAESYEAAFCQGKDASFDEYRALIEEADTIAAGLGVFIAVDRDYDSTDRPIARFLHEPVSESEGGHTSVLKVFVACKWQETNWRPNLDGAL